MATATQESRTVGQLGPRARHEAVAESMPVVVSEDSGGAFRGTLVAVAPPAHDAPSRRGDPRQTYSCPECGHVLRVSGLGRHRVYFELDDDRSVDPVMNRACPSCGRGLPGKNPPATR